MSMSMSIILVMGTIIDILTSATDGKGPDDLQPGESRAPSRDVNGTVWLEA